MNATVMNKENTAVKFSYEASAEKFEEGLKYAYNKNKANIALAGFRKGKAPRKLIEAQYGENFFYEDAINFVFSETYEEALKELDLDVVSQPTLDIENVDKETGVKFIIDVTVKPEVKLGQYKGLEIEKVDISVKDEEVMAELKKVQEKNGRKVDVTDRAAQIDDAVTISFDGSIDGVRFDGGQADSHELTLGSHTFIEGFEEQLVGHNIGDAFDVNVTFPAEYHAPELAGKPAVFAVELKAITVMELPELNDDFAEDVSDFSTMEEYKASILDKLKAGKEEQTKQDQGEKMLDLAIANAEMDVPQIMYDNKIDQMVREFEENIGKQGLSLDIYCQYMGVTKEAMRDNFKETSEKSVKARLMLEQIAKEESLIISKEELNAEIGKYGESYGLDAEKTLEMFRQEDRDALQTDMMVHKAMQLIEESAIVK